MIPNHYPMPGETEEQCLARLTAHAKELEADANRLVTFADEVILTDPDGTIRTVKGVEVMKEWQEHVEAVLSLTENQRVDIKNAAFANLGRHPLVGTNPCAEIVLPDLLPDYLDGKPTGRLFSRLEIPGKDGYINQFGKRVPNPCGEIDMQGRDLDKVCRWLRPTDKMNDDTINAILAIDESDPDVIAAMKDRSNHVRALMNGYGYVMEVTTPERMLDAERLYTDLLGNSDRRPAERRMFGGSQ